MLSDSGSLFGNKLWACGGQTSALLILCYHEELASKILNLDFPKRWLSHPLCCMSGRVLKSGPCFMRGYPGGPHGNDGRGKVLTELVYQLLVRCYNFAMLHLIND